ncbi:cysteine hydrolase family protein [Bosea sp. RCC_152_1]|uniref:cysteine hydrolase family protein n=1 Tax=Bosea sp. RCC_152_1 TaxID=3239228 RepID=UPI0035237576
MPVEREGDGRGTWQRYYRRWPEVTLERAGADAVRLMPSLERFVPPAQVLDKRVYSPWTEGDMDRFVAAREIDTVIVTGGGTDVCVLATVLRAVDRGLRVVLVTDALCSSSDATHDGLMELYLSRFSQQIEAATTEEVLAHWR